VVRALLEREHEIATLAAVAREAAAGAGSVVLAAQAESVELRRALGDPRPLGASLRWLSRIQWGCGNRSAAERAGTEAVAVLENAGDGRLLAMAYSNQAQLAMLAERHTEPIEYGERAALGAEPLARRVRTRLREVGVARIPRGPINVTRTRGT
jgi:hypothetical protein